jgi:hypothetical protein
MQITVKSDADTVQTVAFIGLSHVKDAYDRPCAKLPAQTQELIQIGQHCCVELDGTVNKRATV